MKSIRQRASLLEVCAHLTSHSLTLTTSPSHPLISHLPSPPPSGGPFLLHPYWWILPATPTAAKELPEQRGAPSEASTSASFAFQPDSSQPAALKVLAVPRRDKTALAATHRTAATASTGT